MTRSLRSRRFALLGTVVVLGLSACGSSDATGSPASSTLPAPQVIEVAGGASGRTEAAPAAADSIAVGEAGSKMMAAFLTYVFQGDVPDLTAPAASWSFPAGVTVTDEQLRALAAAFGVSGDPQDIPADMGGGRTIGSTDYTGPSVTVGTDALLSWWYNPGSDATAVASPPCAYFPEGDPAADPTTADLPVCEEPTPPAGVPTKDEAEAKATALFASLGMDASQWTYDTYADEWGAYVTATYVIDGISTNLTASVGFGGEGAVTWASGFLATPQRSADYPRIGVDAAVQRLNDQTLGWMGGGVMARGGVATDVAASSGPAAASSGAGVAVAASSEAVEPPATDVLVDPVPAVLPPVDCLATTDVAASSGAAESVAPDDTAPVEPGVLDTGVVDTVTPLPEPLPVDCGPMTPPEPITVTLTSPTASLEQVWADDGTVWLLPGYRFETSDGSWVTVVAVEDQYLQQSQPEPLPIDVPVDTVVDGTAPIDTTAPGDTTAPVDSTPVACAGLPTAVTEPGLSMAIADTIVGMCLDDARAFVEGYQPGASLRVVREDGVDLAVTADFQESRVNVAVENGVVTEVVSLG